MSCSSYHIGFPSFPKPHYLLEVMNQCLFSGVKLPLKRTMFGGIWNCTLSHDLKFQRSDQNMKMGKKDSNTPKRPFSAYFVFLGVLLLSQIPSRELSENAYSATIYCWLYVSNVPQLWYWTWYSSDKLHTYTLHSLESKIFNVVGRNVVLRTLLISIALSINNTQFPERLRDRVLI